MTEALTASRPKPRSLLRSSGALLAGMVAVVILSIATDAVLHSLKVFPPEDRPMNDPGLNLLALAYRCIYGAAGSWIAARLAPSAPMGHALALGGVGVLLSLAGVIVTWNMGLGPHWYPVALVVTALPFAWLGGRLAIGARR